MPPDAGTDPIVEERPRAIWRSVAHESAAKHVTGSALYIDDVTEPAGTLHVAPYGSAIARGRLVAMHLEAVRTAPGVVAVLTAADVPGKNNVSPVPFDVDEVFVEERIAFHGHVLFAVVAETREQARRAALLARVETVAETPLVSVDDALASGDTVLPDYQFLRGEPAERVKAAPHRTSGTLRIGGQEHFYLEGQISLVTPGEDGDTHVLCSTQHPTEVQHLVAKVLGVNDHAVVCEVRRMGGGFGGKESQAAQWAAIAAIGARVTGRPCKIRLDRDDDMAMTGKRHDFRVDYAAGFDGTGRLQGYEVTYASRCGYSVDLSLGINDRTMFHADNAYFLGEARILSRRMKTNTVSNTAFRGFGGPQGLLGVERVMDAIAWKLGLDPLDVRKANLYGPGRDVTPYGQTVTDNIAPELIERLEASSDYRSRREALKGFNERSAIIKKGIALTPVKFGISFTLIHLNRAGALVHVYGDGSISLNHGGTEMGQGLYTKVAQVVADEFGVSLDRVKVTATTTAKVPNTAPTAASSGTDLNGMAAKIAAGKIRERLAEVAALELDAAADDVEFRDDHAYAGNRSIAFGDLAMKALHRRVQLSATGHYATPDIHWDRDKATGRPFFYYAYGAACSEVSIDTLTGEMRVDRVDILHDVGRSLNPALDIGQIEGGFVQGMGWLTTEELVFDAQGRLRTHAPSTYKIPTCSDVPEDFRVALWDGENRVATIGRSKAVGEPPLMLAVSVFCAIADAVYALAPGHPVELDAPATPEAILKAVRSARRAG